MYVKPAYRGLGINKKIIAEIKDLVAQHSISELRLLVYCENHSAIRAYEKAGFGSHSITMRMEI